MKGEEAETLGNEKEGQTDVLNIVTFEVETPHQPVVSADPPLEAVWV